MNAERKPSVCIVSYPIPAEIRAVPLERLIGLLAPLTGIVLISSNFPTEPNRTIAARIRSVKWDSGSHTFAARVLKLLLGQVRVSIEMVRVRSLVNQFIFYVGGSSSLVIPFLTGRFLRKKTFLIVAGSGTKSVRGIYDGFVTPSNIKLVASIMTLAEQLCFVLSSQIVTYSPGMVREAGLFRYSGKIVFMHEHYVDFDKFAILKPYSERENIVGYVGRLSGEKGISNLIEAFNCLHLRREEIKLLIIGEGYLREHLQKTVDSLGMDKAVSFLGWISHERLPIYLNQMKMLVLPSLTEGLPNVMLEAMACGTPVLASPVGAIPDVLKNESTGFILDSTEPSFLAKAILRVLENPTVSENVSTAASNYVRDNFDLRKTRLSWKALIGT